MYYGLPTESANQMVLSIVKGAVQNQLPWRVVYQLLKDLSKSNPTVYGGVLNTKVCEWIYDEIGAAGRRENFYI